MDKPDRQEAVEAREQVVARAWEISHEAALRDLAAVELKERLDEWAHEVGKGGRTLAYEKKGPNRATMVALLRRPGIQAWDNFTVPMSMREVEPGVSLIMSTMRFGGSEPDWRVMTVWECALKGKTALPPDTVAKRLEAFLESPKRLAEIVGLPDCN